MRSKTGCVVHLKVDSSPRKRGLSADKVDSFPRECGFYAKKVDSSPRERGLSADKVDSSPRKCGLSADKVDSFLGEVIRLTPCFSWGNEDRKG